MAWYSRKKPTQLRTTPAEHSRLIKSVSNNDNAWYRVNAKTLNSPNLKLRQSIDEVRELSREVCAKNGYAQKYIEMLSVYTVGAEGMTLDPRVTFSDGTLDSETNAKIKAAWDDWSQHHASYNKRRTFNQMEASAIRSLGRDGEMLFQIVRGANAGKYGFALLQTDIACLDTRINARLPKGYVMMGVECSDENGEIVAYHLRNPWASSDLALAAEIGAGNKRVDAKNILHHFDDEYGDGLRGMPWTSSVLLTIARLAEYTDAHLLACQLAANVPLVLSNKEGEPLDSTISNVGVNGETSTPTPQQQPALNLKYQQILETPYNQEIKALDLKYPTAGFAEALKEYLQQISAGLFVSYASMTSDSSNEAWSTVRHQSIMERDHWKQIIADFKQAFHMRVYREWLECAMLSSALDLPGKPEDYYNVDFRSRGFAQADPRKEMDANLKGISEGLFTRSQLATESGQDWEENILQLQREQDFAKAHGVVLPEAPPSNAAVNVNVNNAQPVKPNEPTK